MKDGPPIRPDRPSAVLFDIGMTMVFPSGDVMVREIARLSPGLTRDPKDAARALCMAAEAQSWQNGTSRSHAEMVGRMWGYLLDLPNGVGPAAWERCIRSPDLYAMLDPDSIDVLQALRNLGIKTAAVTNSMIPHRAELAAFGLLDFFDASIGSEEGHPEKPAPEMFRLALDRLNVCPSESWHVGDGLVNDVLGSSLAGVAQQVLVDRYAIHVNPPCCRVGSMAELRDIVSGL